MLSDHYRKTPGRSPARARTATSLASTRGHGGGSYGATGVYVRGECGEDGWVPRAGETPLYRWFLVRVVLALDRSVYSSSSGWVKSSVSWTMAPISSYDTSCINSSSRMWPESSGVMVELVGEFKSDLVYSD